MGKHTYFSLSGLKKREEIIITNPTTPIKLTGVAAILENYKNYKLVIEGALGVFNVKELKASLKEQAHFGVATRGKQIANFWYLGELNNRQVIADYKKVMNASQNLEIADLTAESGIVNAYTELRGTLLGLSESGNSTENSAGGLDDNNINFLAMTDYLSELGTIVDFINSNGVGYKPKYVATVAWLEKENIVNLHNTVMRGVGEVHLSKTQPKAELKQTLSVVLRGLFFAEDLIYSNFMGLVPYIQTLGIRYFSGVVPAKQQATESLGLESQEFKNFKSIPALNLRENRLKRLGYHNSSYRLYTKIIENKLIKKEKRMDSVELSYGGWGEAFINLENKVENSIEGLLENKLEQDLKNYSTSIKKNKENTVGVFDKSLVEETLQNMEQAFSVHLGNNYIRELIYAHYGS